MILIENEPARKPNYFGGNLKMLQQISNSKQRETQKKLEYEQGIIDVEPITFNPLAFDNQGCPVHLNI